MTKYLKLLARVGVAVGCRLVVDWQRGLWTATRFFFNERKLVLEMLKVVKVKVKVTMKKFRNSLVLP